MRRRSSLISCLCLVAGQSACATVPQQPASADARLCDARVEFWGWVGSSEMTRDRALFEVVNSSTREKCRASRVTLIAVRPIDEDLVRIATPEGWTAVRLPCTSGEGVCGVEWRHPSGIPPGQSQRGFGLLAPRMQTPRLTSLVVQVGDNPIAIAAAKHYGTEP